MHLLPLRLLLDAHSTLNAYIVYLLTYHDAELSVVSHLPAPPCAHALFRLSSSSSSCLLLHVSTKGVYKVWYVIQAKCLHR